MWKHRLAAVNLDERTAICSVCGPTKIKVRKRPNRIERICMTRVDAERGLPVSRHVRITRSEYDERLIAQSGRCAVCATPMQKPCVDHDHRTGEVRGLLCASCNTMLGHAKDSILILGAAIDYLAPQP